MLPDDRHALAIFDSILTLLFVIQADWTVPHTERNY